MNFSLLLSLIFFSLHFQTILSYGWVSTTELWDLETTTNAAFSNEAAAWSCTRLVNNNIKYSTCDGIYLLGGYNIMGGVGLTGNAASYGQYFYRTYAPLPAHNQINLTYTVYAIDSWDGTTSDDHFEVDIDGNSVTGWHFSAFAGYATQLCGGSWVEFPPVRAYMTFPHTALSMLLKVISYLDQGSTDESLGFRDIQLDFVYMARPATSVCGRSNGTPLPDKACPCSTTNEYMRPPNSGTCFPCHSSCATCDEGTSNDCLSCYEGNYLRVVGAASSCQPCNSACRNCTGPNINQCGACKEGYFLVGTTCYPTCNYPLYNVTLQPGDVNYCYTPCPGQYAYNVNGNCSSSCPYPLVGTTNNTYLVCNYFCEDGQFLYWNGSCINNCILPLIPRYESGKSFCDFICPSNQVMYWDGMCAATTSCVSPLKLEVQGTAPNTRSFCKFPCAANQFLYANGTCDSSCPSPWKQVIKNSRMFCEYPCTGTQYLYWNGSCINSCDFPLSRRLENGYRFCDFPCADGTDFLYWNGTCSDDCDAPLSQRLEANKSYCDFPCPTTTDFLYWDGSCETNCPRPYTPVTEGTTMTRKFCEYQCDASTEFLYWDGTCSTSCDFPLETDSYKGKPLCEFPCTPTTDFLYWNGTCSDSCDLPLATRSDNSRNFCDFPCATTLPDYPYLYSNGSCLSSCETPRLGRNQSDGTQYCYFPCDDKTEFAYINGSCTSDCEDPFVTKIDGTSSDYTSFCLFKCSADEFLQDWSGNCTDSCPTPYRTSVQYGDQYCQWPCDNFTDYYYTGSGFCNEHCRSPYYIKKDQPYLQCVQPPPSESGSSLFNMFLRAPLQRGALTVVTLVKVMQYVRYLDIKMPPRLQRLGISRGRNVLSFSSGMTMWSSFENDFVKVPMKEIYERSGLHSSFLVNFWEDFTTILIGVFIAGIIWGLGKICDRMKWELAKSVFLRLLVIAKWNFVVMVIAISIDDILLFSVLEFKTFHNSGSAASSVFSLLFCLFFFIGIFAMMGAIYYLIKKQRKLRIRVVPIDKKQTTPSRAFYERWACVQVVFRGFTQSNLFTELFFVFYMLRIGIPILIAVIFEKFPLIITILELLISIGVLAFLIKLQPFRKKINHYQILLFEFIVLCMNFWMLILTIISITNAQAETLSVILGDLVIVGNDTINLMCLGFLVFKLHLGIDEISVILLTAKKHSTLTLYEKTMWLKLIALPLQQAYMGFEEMIDEYDVDLAPPPAILPEGDKYNSRPIVKAKVEGLHKNKLTVITNFPKFFQNDLVNKAKQIADNPPSSGRRNLSKIVSFKPDLSALQETSYPGDGLSSIHHQSGVLWRSDYLRNEDLASTENLDTSRIKLSKTKSFLKLPIHELTEQEVYKPKVGDKTTTGGASSLSLNNLDFGPPPQEFNRSILHNLSIFSPHDPNKSVTHSQVGLLSPQDSNKTFGWRSDYMMKNNSSIMIPHSPADSHATILTSTDSITIDTPKKFIRTRKSIFSYLAKPSDTAVSQHIDLGHEEENHHENNNEGHDQENPSRKSSIDFLTQS